MLSGGPSENQASFGYGFWKRVDLLCRDDRRFTPVCVDPNYGICPVKGKGDGKQVLRTRQQSLQFELLLHGNARGKEFVERNSGVLGQNEKHDLP